MHPPSATARQPAPGINPFDYLRQLGTQALAARPPIDLTRIVPAAGQGPCAPVRVAQSVWIAPDCSRAMARTVRSSPFVARRGFNLESIGALPGYVDLRTRGLDGPVKDQQMVGICWAFAMSTVMDNAIRRSGRAEVIAPLHVLSSKLWDEVWDKGRSDRAITAEPAWPYDPVKACKLNEAPSEIWCEEAYHVRRGSWRSDPALVAEVERANATGLYRISKMQSLDVGPTHPDQLASILAQGQSIWAAFDYNRNAWEDFQDGDSVIPDWFHGDGGHAVVIVGYRSMPHGRQFLLHNSWGDTWFERGYAWVSEAMVRRHVLDAFTVDVEPGPSAPRLRVPQLPQLPRANDSCVRDLFTGQCAAACRNGLPPIAGMCAP